jgi:hypothetical protein
MVQQLLFGQGLLNIEASRSHSDTPHQTELCTSDQPEAENSIPEERQHSQETENKPPAESEPAIPGNERPQTDNLDRSATGIGYRINIFRIYCIKICKYVYFQASNVRRPRNQKLIPFWKRMSLFSKERRPGVGLPSSVSDGFRMIFPVDRPPLSAENTSPWNCTSTRPNAIREWHSI